MKKATIAEKDLYLIDGFFQQKEKESLTSYYTQASFSRNSYGSSEAIQNGEKPASSMNGKERWIFFHRPPAAIQEVYNLFSQLSEKLHVDVTTLPWELCDAALARSPAVIANKLEAASEESMEWGKHQDSNPGKRLPFGIPILYSEGMHPEQFLNGSEGRPWMVSVMVYSTAADFLPEYGLGTVFYDESQQIALRVNCQDLRLVLFEGDLFHSIEASNIPHGKKTWRISYVFKMILNPKRADCSPKQALFELMHHYSLEEINSFGHDFRA